MACVLACQAQAQAGGRGVKGREFRDRQLQTVLTVQGVASLGD